MWIRITAPYFVVGVEFIDTEEGSVVSKAAPIVGYMVGWTRNKVLEYANHKMWNTTEFLNEKTLSR